MGDHRFKIGDRVWYRGEKTSGYATVTAACVVVPNMYSIRLDNGIELTATEARMALAFFPTRKPNRNFVEGDHVLVLRKDGTRDAANVMGWTQSGEYVEVAMGLDRGIQVDALLVMHACPVCGEPTKSRGKECLECRLSVGSARPNKKPVHDFQINERVWIMNGDKTVGARVVSDDQSNEIVIFCTPEWDEHLEIRYTYLRHMCPSCGEPTEAKGERCGKCAEMARPRTCRNCARAFRGGGDKDVPRLEGDDYVWGRCYEDGSGGWILKSMLDRDPCGCGAFKYRQPVDSIAGENPTFGHVDLTADKAGLLVATTKELRAANTSMMRDLYSGFINAKDIAFWPSITVPVTTDMAKDVDINFKMVGDPISTKEGWPRACPKCKSFAQHSTIANAVVCRCGWRSDADLCECFGRYILDYDTRRGLHQRCEECGRVK